MWLLNEETARQLQKAEEAGLVPTAEQQRGHEAEIEARASNGPRNMSVAGTVAEIRIEGTLTKKPDLFAMLFGGGNTSYRDIQAAFAAAASDPVVKEVSLYVDSPGGNVDGLFDTLTAIENFKASGKRVRVRAAKATSAAYGIAAVAGKIEATNPGAMFGSIGVAAAYLLDEQIVQLTNTDSPDKRPDLSTEEGKAVVVKTLDSIYSVFADHIANGRGISVDEVKEKYGRGAELIASDAKKRGMIDSIARPMAAPAPVVSAEPTPILEPVSSENVARDKPIPTATEGEQEKHMELKNLQDLQAHNPDLYEAAVKLGAEQERDRVNAHLINGQSCDAMDIALTAIEDGSAMTQTLQAKYNAAGRNKADKVERQESTDEAAKAAKGADESTPTEKDLGDQVVAILKGEVS